LNQIKKQLENLQAESLKLNQIKRQLANSQAESCFFLRKKFYLGRSSRSLNLNASTRNIFIDIFCPWNTRRISGIANQRIPRSTLNIPDRKPQNFHIRTPEHNINSVRISRIRQNTSRGTLFQLHIRRTRNRKRTCVTAVKSSLRCQRIRDTDRRAVSQIVVANF